ncbi:MAG: quinohemoprotein amine dehydrogenase subunit alpha [Gemmatimonas sp.]|nr:quinohemoprotein amine dehydrogenase subunit alpha [Gemmatimonas sp.]
MREERMVGGSRRAGRRAVKWIAAGVAVLGGVGSVGMMRVAEEPAAGRGGSAALAVADTGFVIESEAVIENCGGCHVQDETGRMGRLSYLRKTPEGWQNSIRRMVSLHGVQLEPEAAREVVHYLANAQGLAPDELGPGLFEVERRMEPFRYEADRSTERTCSACHSMGRVITQRRTAEEWELLITTHRSLYPLVDRQVFYSESGGEEDSEDEDSEDSEDSGYPVEQALEHLSEAFPLHTPEWEAWSANVRPARVEGTWAITGNEHGKGNVYGTMEVQAVAGTTDEFTTSVRYQYVATGAEVTATGSSLVYTGHQWRGRSEHSGASDPLREVMSIDRGWEEMTGRWFHGAHDEFGIDVTVRRADGALISGIHPMSLRTGNGVQEVRVYGANLPEGLSLSDVDLGPGVTVREVVSASPDLAVLQVEAAADAQVGERDVFVGGAFLSGGVAVYDSVDGIRVTPDLGMARVGGVVAPKQFQPFQAVGIDYGVDDEAGTEDDIEIGMVPVEWRLDEYPVTYDDDDLQFVGSIDADGLFTPASDGPNPERSGNRNNMGEVWVVATYRDPTVDVPVEGRAYLIVTAPILLRWGETEP